MIMKVLLIVLLLAVGVLTNAFELKYDNNVAVPKQQSRITNGILAENGQFKYQVGLYIKRAQTSSVCGGSLIAPTWIVTAAHCIDGAISVLAFMGSTGFLSGGLVPVSQGILHGQWDPQTVANDICLLKIPPINLGQNIAPVALPPLGGSENSYVNDNVIASGWGIKSDQDQEPAKQLQYARLKIVPNSVCLRRYGSYMFKGTNICAQGPSGTSACKGDSGGPIVSESGVLVGITSYGSAAGCTLGYPDVFTRVSSYRSWINDITGV